MKTKISKRLVPALLAGLLAVALCTGAMAEEVEPVEPVEPVTVTCKECDIRGLTTGPLHATNEYEKISETMHVQYYECDNGHKQIRFTDEGEYRDLFPHAASKNATCTEAAVCGDCNESFGAPLDHDVVLDAEVPATCAKTGLTAGSHCQRCGVILVKQEVIDKLEHEYDEGRRVAPTCSSKGGILFTCKNCKATLLTEEENALSHWYDEWNPVKGDKMSAPCKRTGCWHVKTTDCVDWEFKLLSADDEEPVEYSVCPVCGETSDGTRLKMIQNPAIRSITGWAPEGDLTIRVGELENGEKIMSLAFEFDARLVQHSGNAEYTIPAEILEGYKLMLLDEDGNETELEVTVKGKKATFAVDFTAPWQERTPVRVMHLVPVEA